VKFFLSFTLSAITAGALTAFVLCARSTQTEVAPVRARSAALPASRGAIVATAAPAPNWLQRTISGAAAWLNEGRGSAKPGHLGLLLREPVIILRGGGVPGSSLPVGTAVRLVRNDGRFLRVQHEQNVITLPRTAVVEGISRAE
jgi:hypothetical protein